MEDSNPPVTSSPSSSSDPHPDPHDSVHQSPPPDDVTFRLTHLQIQEDPTETDDADNEAEEDDDEDDDDDDEVDDDGDFTFACVGGNDDNDNDNGNGLWTTEVYESNETGQIRKAFPLFDQSLLLSTGDYDDGNRRLPIDVAVDKVFIESPPSEYGVTDKKTILAVAKDSDSEINMKSNSTGFSKLWRFRNNEMNRSNSDGRDAFVFLETSTTATTATTATTSDGKHDAVKVNGGKGKGVERGLKEKRKKVTASAHEVYLKQKGQTEEERRRSYLPYRPGLMGFFTNVNGGLSKNVHPF